MDLPEELLTDIKSYCVANNITDIDGYIIKISRQGHTMEKFGATPILKEKIVEKIVEVPVEKIVDKIIEKIIEIPVEKEVFITNDEEQKKLINKIEELESKIKLIEEIKAKEILELSSKLDETNKLVEIEKAKKQRDIYNEL